MLSQLIKGICETLQAFVDPFDLDVFMPFILANLESKLSHSLVSQERCTYGRYIFNYDLDTCLISKIEFGKDTFCSSNLFPDKQF